MATGGMRTTLLGAVVALAIAVGGAVPKSPPGAGIDPTELKELEDFINSLLQEESSLQAQMQLSVAANAQLLSQIQGIQQDTLPQFDAVGEQQTAALDGIGMRLSGLLALFCPLEAAVSGLKVMSQATEAYSKDLGQLVDDLRAVTHRQDAALVRVNTVLDEARQKAEEKTGLRVQQSSVAMAQLHQDLQAMSDFMDSRTCLHNSVMVELDPETGSGSADMVISPDGVLGYQPPSVVCVLESFQTDLDLRGTTASDSQKSVALTIDCQPATDKVKVTAVDQSQGQGNSFTKAYVNVKACSLGAMV